MASKNYIKTTEVAEITGRPYNEILKLANTGVLPGYKTRRGRWLLNIADVERYFAIKIKDSTEEINLGIIKSPRNADRNYGGKLISGYTARKYLDCSKAEFENLVKQGIIKAYRDEQSRWKVSKESVINYAQRSLSSSDTRLILNENHYEEVMERICKAQSSIKIMTANFKRFRLKPSDEQGKDYNDGTPFIQYLMDKAVHGVPVQIICSNPSPSFTEEWEDFYRKMNEPDLFEYKFCDRNHAKAVIIDDSIAYVGSANVTPAGLGQGIFTPGNFELGIITENSEIISSLKAFFSKIWSGDYCRNCHRAKQCSE